MAVNSASGAVPSLSAADVDRLREACHQQCTKAYAPYSRFPVAAAVLSTDDRLFSGCNIENASYPAGCCAERVAIFQGVAQGVREFRALAVWTPEGEGFASPCGICRQVIAEFFPPEAPVLRFAPDLEGYALTTVQELLPFAFELDPASEASQ